eukprot:4861935-Amphidinium_carterae.1
MKLLLSQAQDSMNTCFSLFLFLQGDMESHVATHMRTSSKVSNALGDVTVSMSKKDSITGIAKVSSSVSAGVSDKGLIAAA